MNKNLFLITVMIIIVSTGVVWADNLTVSVESVSAYPGDSSVAVPIIVHNAETREVYGIDLSLSYDPSLIEVVEVRKSNFTANWSLVANTKLVGEVKIALYHTAALTTAKGELVWIVFDVKPQAQAGKKSVLHLSKAQLGEVSADSTRDGYIEILQPKEYMEYILNITIRGGGSVIPAPNKIHYKPGESVALEAIAEDNYHFLSWSGDLFGNESPRTMIMDANKSITAHFEIDATAPGAATSAGHADRFIPVPVAIDRSISRETPKADAQSTYVQEEKETSNKEIKASLDPRTRRKELIAARQVLNKEVEQAPKSMDAFREYREDNLKSTASKRKQFAPQAKRITSISKGRRERKTKLTLPIIQAKQIKRFLIWRTYQLTLQADTQPYYWQLTKDSRLPWGLRLNKRQGTISGIVLGKKIIEPKLIIITEDRNRIEASCKLELR